ncbi:EAL domain-containing protein [Thalassococcus sp. BH17M4-6]|uniref:EAL domain-containing protein n=1 Tax=Thalassococcus sp. BH17M4-6 TaxID=3413148 RepID=UPI003BE709F0
MSFQLLKRGQRLRDRTRRALSGAHALALIPAAVLAAFWIGGEPVLLAVALGLPVLFALAGGFDGARGSASAAPQADLADIGQAHHLSEEMLARARGGGLSTACLLIEVEGFAPLLQRHGEQAMAAAQDLCLSRLRTTLRNDDRALRLGDARFMVLASPAPRMDLESLLQMARRLQSAIEEPAAISGTTCFFSASIGFCSSNRLGPSASGEEMFDSAASALAEAAANGPSAIRAWSDRLGAARTARADLRSAASQALENGQIQPWFQPQICTSTGRISGVEALARWVHPDRGLIAPPQFLQALEDDRRMERLSEVIVTNALTALCAWDKAGCEIPRVSVNFSMSELRNPALVDKIAWELDRFDMPPARLGIEVLETVITETCDGTIARNIANLTKLGCHIDLDDFGIGTASIAALRRFPVHRVKIDRSFVTRIDRDEEQRRMLSAILGMADRLGLETLAEGVESIGEHALLAQLGCDHVQGFGIARAMPADQIDDWTRKYRDRIGDAAKLGRRGP